MSDYRAYLIGSDGHIFTAIDVEMPDDAAAIATALQLIDGHDIELWQGPRKIANLNKSINIPEHLAFPFLP